MSAYDLDPRLASVARPARAVSPGTSLGFVAEVLRTSPYRSVPVVAGAPKDGVGDAPRLLVGMVREADLLRAFLNAGDGPQRARVRENPAQSVMTAPPATRATPLMRAREAAALLEEAGEDALPVVDLRGGYLGMVARSDLVQDLVRPFRPPLVGGMATPLGVYLTTGNVSGGVSALALMLSGLALFGLHAVSQALILVSLAGLTRLVGPGALAALPNGVRALDEVVAPLLQTLLFLLFLRLSPIAGYHAAEHQVVHALERAEPLSVETVRAMPRVHPRCGTNLVAGLLIVTLGATLFVPLLDHIAGNIGAVLGGFLCAVFALAYWRTLGAWLQQHFTTRPATDVQILSGIRAARELLQAHGRAPFGAPLPQQRPSRWGGRRPPFARLWRLGFLQIMGGFLIGLALLSLAARFIPALRPLANGLFS